MSSKTVKFQHRIATGHSVPAPPKVVETKDKDSDEVTKTMLRHYTTVPTQLVVDDALVLAEHSAPDSDQPRVMLLYRNGNPLMGADWHNAVSMEVDVPHRDHEGAEESERFYFDPNEDIASYVEGAEKRSASQTERIRDLTLANQILTEKLAQTTEGKDEALQKAADEFASSGIFVSPLLQTGSASNAGIFVSPLLQTGSASNAGSTLVSSATGSSAEPPVSQPDSGSDQDTDPANGQQDGQPVSGVAGQIQGQQQDAASSAPQVAGDAAQIDEAPSPEQPAQQQAPANNSAPSAPSGSD
jgi:hypothetical protein